MLRSALGKVAWVGRTASMVFGLALVLALVLGLAATAWSATGGNFILGRANSAGAVSKLTANVAGPALQLVNNGTGAAATALNLAVASGKPPLTVNAAAGKATNLNVDELDGKDFGAFGASETGIRGGPLPLQHTFTSSGGTHIVWASGSGFRAAGNTRLEGNIGMNVFVDGTFWTKVGVFANERDSHKAFVSGAFVVRGLPAGTHTIRLEEAYDSACNTANETRSLHSCTTTNDDDLFQVTVTEIPD